MKPIQVYLHPKQIKQLKQEALDQDITLSDLIRKYLESKQPVAKLTEADRAKLCPTHGVPLDNYGRCLQKGCKYA